MYWRLYFLLDNYININKTILYNIQLENQFSKSKSKYNLSHKNEILIILDFRF